MSGKAAGGLLLLLLAVIWAQKRRHTRRALLRREAAWISLLCRVREEISALAAPLPVILRRLDRDGLRETGEEESALKADFSGALLHSGGELPGAFGATLREMAGELGKTWRPEELAREQVWIDRLSRAYETERADAARRGRLEGVLSLCAALGLVLILW